MPIITLPEDTIRLLGSPTVITTPVSLIKELLENAIDAEATSIEILISPNTVDRVEVRDNGHGIHPDDYASLGRAGHTSKITSYEDLRIHGGATLGFRGQALASANNLGTVTITTKFLGDQTGTLMKLAPGTGGVESQQRAPASKGTIVSVSGLFSRTPVREQVVVNEAPQNLAKIRHVLQTYALGRPHIRLSFRVLGGSSKHSWMYSPVNGASIKEAIVQVFGTELMSQCLTRVICSSAEETDCDGGQEKDKFTIEAVLPKPDATPSKISKGAFFSVDSRPVSTRRGTMKKLLASFRLQLSKALGTEDGQRTLRDPFIQVNIKCSAGSYDPNIEPSKDEVLFANESRLTDLFEKLCSEMYANTRPSDAFVTFRKRQLLPSSRIRTPPQSSDGVAHEVGANATALGDNHDHDDRHMTHTPLNSTSSPSGEYQSAQAAMPNRASDQVHQAILKDGSFSAERQSPLLSPNRDVSVGYVPDDRASIRMTLQRLSSNDMTQRVTNPSSAPELRRRPGPLHDSDSGRGWTVDMSTDPNMSSDEEAEHLAARFRAHQEAGDQSQGGGADPKQGLNPWTIAKMAGPSRPNGEVHVEPDHFQVRQGEDDEDQRLPIAQPYGRISDIDHGRNTHVGISPMGLQQHNDLPDSQYPYIGHDIRTVAPFMPHVSQNPNAIGGPHVLPNLMSGHHHTDGMRKPQGIIETGLPPGRPRRTRRKSNEDAQLHIDDVPSRPYPSYKKPRRTRETNGWREPVAEDALDIRIGLEDSVDNRRITDYVFGNQQYESPRNIPHSLDPLGELSPNVSQQPTESIPITRLSRSEQAWLDGDSRKYLMKRQRSEAEHRRRGRQPRKRAKTDQLPLEKVPDDSGVQHLVQTVAPDPKQLKENSGYWAENDVFHADCRAVLSLRDKMSLEDVEEVEVRLRNVLCAWTENVLGASVDVELDIRNLKNA